MQSEEIEEIRNNLEVSSIVSKMTYSEKGESPSPRLKPVVTDENHT